MNELGTAFLTQNFLNTCHVPDLCTLQEPKIGKIKHLLSPVSLAYKRHFSQEWDSSEQVQLQA